MSNPQITQFIGQESWEIWDMGKCTGGKQTNKEKSEEKHIPTGYTLE